MMHRVLSQGSLRQMACVRAMGKTHLAMCCVGPGQRWVSTSFITRVVDRLKPKPPRTDDQEPPSPPPSLAGTEPLYVPDSARQPPEAPPEAQEIDPLQDKSIGLVQRFKKTFKQYGKVMIPVHLLSSTIWFGTFYYAAMKGVNVVPFLEFIGLPEKIVGLLNNSSGGNALTAYAMYKIATPARYTVTLGGTSLSVKYLRKHGYFSTPPPVKDYLQDRMEETREKLTEKMEETKELFSEKMEETKELLSGKMEDTKERFSEKMEETKERFSGKMEETKERFSGKMEETKERFSGKMEETKERFSGKMEETKERISGKMEETKERFSDKLKETKGNVAYRKKID
ncbi:uncharacterized protein C18orf19 homolog B-like [Esox lucius]|uniref:DUF1279 domain-containing protein n=1 Tax=Esox lucius TaxID=8010 RepID=A0AAY5KID2_ESOLU|nr:uncharacterized protein C18orf19 homolog B-like [Esox lucius]XP_028969461.1 uncharacterized protein C18orf19 homolog B-like [Esox lucius]XP_028969462.1 uncharacterized protein C18orf19 homolog B-like [Esox lucius]XP_028969463.1 uncharacterized protein C18orf19 homolog B-like [Esox lucius]XP_028969464.1 uncharacterized protein C18orf19 homolog B-like [Esox lucius]